MDIQKIINASIQQKLLSKSPFKYEDYYNAGNSYFCQIRNRDYKALVLDYDKTIHNKKEVTLVEAKIRQILNDLLSQKITICIATGNGEYITDELREYFDTRFHASIYIGYYNCGLIAPLNKDVDLDSTPNTVPLDFQLVKDFFYSNSLEKYIISEGFISQNPYELNFYTESGDIGYHYLNILKEFIQNNTTLKIMSSPHSFDVVPFWISKLDICKHLEHKGILQKEILTIGDCGAQGKSDYELLCNENSLSVNTVSNALHSCWKLTPPELYNLDATCYYLKSIKLLKDGLFKILQY